MNPITFAMRRPWTVIVALGRISIELLPGTAAQVVRCLAGPDGRRIAGAADGRGHLPQPESAGDLRLPAVRRYGSGADGRLADQLLRISFPLHQQYPPRRKPQRAGDGADEVVLPSGHEYGPGDGRDDQLRQPFAGVHAARHGVAVRDAVRHGQRSRRLSGPVQQHADGRRDPGPGAVQSPADVLVAAGRFGAAAVRRQRPHDRGPGSTGPAACLRAVAG